MTRLSSIGRSIALSFAKANAACLILVSRIITDLSSVSSEIRDINPKIRVHTYAVDVTAEKKVARIKDEVIEKEGKLNVLVNNAGASSPWVPIPESDAVGYWRSIEVNLKGPFLFLHAFLPLLKETGEKTGKGTDVINVSSIGAHAVFPGASAYQVSKFAVLRLTEFVDVEFGQDGDVNGVRCFAIHPGAVMTDLTQNSVDAVKSTCVDSPELAGGFWVRLAKGGRSWLRGRYLSVNWDVDELEKKRREIERTDKLRMRMVF